MINVGTLPTSMWIPAQLEVWRLMMLTPTYLTTNPSKNVSELIIPSLNHHRKTSHILPKWRHTVSEAGAHCVPLCPSKVIKLSFLLPPETLSPKITSAPVYREAALSASQSWWDLEEFSGKLMTVIPLHNKRKLKLIVKKTLAKFCKYQSCALHFTSEPADGILREYAEVSEVWEFFSELTLLNLHLKYVERKIKFHIVPFFPNPGPLVIDPFFF